MKHVQLHSSFFLPSVPSVIIHGPPAAGKTSIARMVCAKLRTAYISQDTLLADDVSALAAKAKEHIGKNEVRILKDPK